MSDSEDKPLKKLKTRPFDRNLAMARVGMVTGSQVLGHELSNLFRSKSGREDRDRDFYTRQAAYLADELGRLKGSVMKVGQMLSLYGQYFMPPEAVNVLAGLQDDTPPVDWSVVYPIVEQQLGPRRLGELEIDAKPLASASLGQVHVAWRKADRRKMVLKIQYPGVGDAIDSDVRTLSRLMSMAKVMPKGISLAPIMEEVREMLHQEVDYGREMTMTQTYYDRFRDDPRYVVPEVIEEYCSDQILAFSFEDALHVKSPEVQGLSQARRNHIAGNALDLFFTEFFDWGLVQTDPHFGNFKVRLDPAGKNDQLVLMDFGATRVFSRPFRNHYYDIVAGAYLDDEEQMLRGAEGIGLMRTHFSENVRGAFVEVCRLIIEPFCVAGDERPPREWLTPDGGYLWGRTDLPTRVAGAVSKAAMSRYFRVPPREIVFLHRRLAGVFILLAVLDASIDGREVLAKYVTPVGGR